MKVCYLSIKSILFIAFVLCLSLIGGGCGRVKSGMLISTEAQFSGESPNNIQTVGGRYYEGSRIIAFKPEKTRSVKVLTGDFHSASFPDISCDGKRMLFSGKKDADDPWQIWEMNLRNLKYRKVTSFTENCTDPAYLPNERVVFSKLTVNDTVKSAHCLFSCNSDGADIRQISFSPCDHVATRVLKDGRLLFVSIQILPKRKDAMLMVMRPDGTKGDMFYMNKGADIMVSDPCETADGKILFIESPEEHVIGGRLAGVSYNRPLHSYNDLSPLDEVEFLSVLPVTDSLYMVSCRKDGAGKFAIYEYDPEKRITGDIILDDPMYDILDVIKASAYDRPKKLPSEVDLQVKTGLLLCQDINFTGLLPDGSDESRIKAEMVEVFGVDSTYGVVRVEEDGSFQLKVLADMPFRICTVDENGRILSGPCSWLWLRPNERRGCVGCHEDPELVPVNRIPFAVKIPPVIVPVNIREIKEKSVELE